MQAEDIPPSTSISVSAGSSLALPKDTNKLAETLLDAWKRKEDVELLYDALRSDPALASEIMQAGLLTIYMHMYDRALNSKTSTWTELFLKRFDPEFRSKSEESTRRTQINIFGSWTTDELKAFIRAQSRKILGEVG